MEDISKGNRKVLKEKKTRRVRIHFSELKETLKLKIDNARLESMEYISSFAEDIFLKPSERIQLAITYAYLEIIIEYANKAIQRNLIFEILQEQNQELLFSEEIMDFKDDELVPEKLSHLIPISTKGAFKRYVQRVKKKGILKSLVHGLKNKKSNHSKLTEILKDVIIVYAVNKTTHKTSRQIHEDLKNLLSDFPELIDKGIQIVAPSTIRKFLKEEGKAFVSYAKDNPLDFKRKIIGYLRFFPPSAPLVRVGIDGYLFQVVCADDDTQKPFQLVGEIVFDYKSKAVLGLAFDRTESNVSFRKALKDYFLNTGNRLFREIVMDKFSSHTCRKVKNFLKVLKHHGVYIKRSSNPNNNSRLERFFLTFQDECLGTFLQCSFVGNGVKSKTTNSHPAKKVIISMKKKDFLKSEAEMIHLLTYLLKEYYNKVFKVCGDKSPMDIFKEEKSNHVAVLSEQEIAYMTFDNHQSTIIGCGVYVKRKEHMFLYKKRNLEISTQHYRRLVNTYIDPDDNTKPAYLFERDSKKFLFSMNNIAVIPCAMFDRSEEQHNLFNSFSKESRELALAIKNELTKKELRAETLVGGLSILSSSKTAKVKKQMDGAYLSQQIGVTEKTPEPTISYPNDPNKVTKVPKKSAEQLLIEKWLS